MKLHQSARKHFARDQLTEAGVIHAVEEAVFSAPLEDEDDPRRWLLLGFDDAARLLELVILIFDSGEEFVVHATNAPSRKSPSGASRKSSDDEVRE